MKMVLALLALLALCACQPKLKAPSPAPEMTGPCAANRQQAERIDLSDGFITSMGKSFMRKVEFDESGPCIQLSNGEMVNYLLVSLPVLEKRHAIEFHAYYSERYRVNRTVVPLELHLLDKNLEVIGQYSFSDFNRRRISYRRVVFFGGEEQEVRHIAMTADHEKYGWLRTWENMLSDQAVDNVELMRRARESETPVMLHRLSPVGLVGVRMEVF